jgi:MFS family permease
MSIGSSSPSITPIDNTPHPASRAAIALAVIAAALGFFVDAYDLLLYSIVRNKSLLGVGVAPDALLTTGIDLLNTQLVGMLIGGVAWGIIGDKWGRRRVLFGSIIMYSAATLANGFAGSVLTYGICRFAAGLGLAGELGAGVTLVAELMKKEHRGYGAMIVAAVGVLGVVVASLIGDRFPWRTAYFIGGGLGLALLALRLGVKESLLFKTVERERVSRGNFLALFTNALRLKKFLCLILTAMPIWFAIGILITFSPELGAALKIAPPPQAGRAILLFYLGLTFGDLTNGLLSQVFKTRKKIIALFMVLTAGSTALYCLQPGHSLAMFYAICLIMGWTSGYWALFITVSAEQFGTNLRASAAVSAPNFVRGLTAILTITFKKLSPGLGLIPAAVTVGAVTIVAAAIALRRLDETYGKDLDYVENTGLHQ